MYSTGIFKLAKFKINYKKYNEPIYLLPFGDIHRFSDNCAVENWLDWCREAKKIKNAYFIGMGDYDDMNSTSERALLNKNYLHESTIKSIEDVYLDRTYRLFKEIAFMKGRVIGLMEGNHYGELSNGTTTTQKLCELLDCQYLGVNTFTRLILANLNQPSKTNKIDIWAHHGRGAAQTMGGSINRVEQMSSIAEADIFMMGHDHKKEAAAIPRMRMDEKSGGLTLKERTILLIRTGSFLRGYVDGKVSYIADLALKPCCLGTVIIHMIPRRKEHKGKESNYIELKYTA